MSFTLSYLKNGANGKWDKHGKKTLFQKSRVNVRRCKTAASKSLAVMAGRTLPEGVNV